MSVESVFVCVCVRVVGSVCVFLLVPREELEEHGGARVTRCWTYCVLGVLVVFVFVGRVVSLGVRRSVWRGVYGACLLLVVLFR